jgi:lysophospholipase L1-like esterase
MVKKSLRVVALCDSTTAGTPGFLSPVEAPPDGLGDVTSQFAYWLMQAHPEWDVLNRGVNGERTDQIRARLERDVIAAAPRAVIVIAGVNDIYQGRSASHAIAELEAMYGQAARAGLPVIAGAIVPFNTATVDQNARMAEVNAWVRAWATAHPEVSFVDTRRAVASADSPDLLIDTPDQLHPSPSGYRLMAEAIRPTLERVLRA